MNTVELNSLTLAELKRWFADAGEQAFRGQQVFRWLHGRLVTSFAEMTDLTKALRARLDEQASIHACEVLEERVAEDGTRKYRFGLHDGLQVEGVWMPDERRRTLCVSTQVGCGQGCAFCATGTMGLVRNLSAGEIVGQVEAVQRALRPAKLRRPVSNVVFMGMGEPLANLDAVCAAVEILMEDTGANLSRRHITVSTVGLIPGMREFVRRVPVKLAISLNATTDAQREAIMPVNRRYPLDRLIEACRELRLHGRDRITFEYVMLAGRNDRPEDARRLVRLLSTVSAKVNLIPYNPYPGLPYDRPDDADVLAFQQILIDAGFTAFVRRSRGQALEAACGQLVAGRPGRA